jgi:hypothetical protein
MVTVMVIKSLKLVDGDGDNDSDDNDNDNDNDSDDGNDVDECRWQLQTLLWVPARGGRKRASNARRRQ